MASSGLQGPHSLNSLTVDAVVTKTSPGAYALGETRDGTYYISYIGRSDDNVNGRLKQHVGKHQQFKYGYLPSAKAAFEKECNLYHDFNPPDNKVHPDRPNGSTWACPRCRQFG